MGGELRSGSMGSHTAESSGRVKDRKQKSDKLTTFGSSFKNGIYTEKGKRKVNSM